METYEIAILVTVGVSVLVCCAACLLNAIGYRILGRALEAFIETADEHIFGVQVNMESMHVSIIRGKVEIVGLTVDNPPGFKSDYALKVSRLHCDFNVCSFFGSGCKVIEIDVLEMVDLDINVEMEGAPIQHYGGVESFDHDNIHTNISVILASMSALQGVRRSVAAASDMESAALKAGINGRVRARFHKVIIKDNNGVILHRDIPIMRIQGSIVDIEYEDYYKEEGDIPLVEAVDSIFGLVFRSALKSLLSNLVGRRFASSLTSQRRCCTYSGLFGGT